MSIRYKMLAVCLSIGLIPALLIGTIGWFSSRSIARLSVRELASIAQATAEKIDRDMVEHYGDIQAFCLNQAGQNRTEWYQAEKDTSLVKALDGYIQSYGVIVLSMLVDKDGKLIAVNRHNQDGKPIDTSYLYKKDFRSAEWFQDCITGSFSRRIKLA